MKRTLAVLGLAMLSACGGGGAPDDTGGPYLPPMAEASQLTWPPGTFVFRTQQAWQAAWASAGTPFMDGNGQPWKPPLPSVDFGKHMVVGVSAGSGPNGCSGVGIQAPSEDPASLTFTYVVSTGSGTTACTAVITPLVSFVTVLQSDKPVVFVRRDR